MPEVAQATITVTPVLEGAQQILTEELTGAAGSAGSAAGTAAGNSMGKSLGEGMASAGTSLTKSVTAPIVALGTAATAAWKDVDTGLDTIIQKTGASGDSLDEMQGILRSITTTIPTDFATAGAAIGEVNTRFGVTGQELETLSGQFVKFAQLNNQDVSNSVDSVSKMLAAFGLSADDAGSMLDALNVVGQQTGVDVGTLSDTVAANAKKFQEMGLSAEEAAAFLGQASMAGLDSGTAMMGLKTAMKEATSEGITLDEALANFEATMNSNASESDKLAAAYELFGTRAGGAIENAVSNGTLSLTDFSASLGEFEGSVNSTFEGTLDPMDQFTTTLNEMKIAGAEIVETAGPMLAQVLSGVADVVSTLAEKWGELDPGMQETIIKIAAIAAVAGPLLIIGGKIVGGISAITGGLSSLTGGLGSASAAASAASAPVSAAGASFSGLAATAIKLLAAAAAFTLAALGVKLLADAAVEVSSAGGTAIAVLAGIGVGIAGLMAVTAALAPALTAGAVGIGVFGAAVLAIGAGVDLACAGIQKLLDGVSNLTQTIATNAEGINSVVANLGETASGVLTTVYEGMSLVIETIAGGISGVLDSVAGIIDSIGNAALNAGTGFEKLANAVLNLVNNTGVLDLGATLATVADGVKKINDAAAGSASASTAIQNLGKSFTPLNTAVKAAQTVFTAFGTNATATTQRISASFRAMNLAAGMSNAMNAAIATARSGLATLQSMFASTTFSLNQSIALPHFSLSGTFSAENGTVPTVSVSWYAKAAEYGALFTKPQIIGVGDAAQPELLIGEQKLRELLDTDGEVTNNFYITIDGSQKSEQVVDQLIREVQLRTRMA